MADFSSILKIEVIDQVQDRRQDGVRCSVCFQDSSSVAGTLPGCSHGVCQSCLDLVSSNDTNIFCVTCQVRSVSPNPDCRETSTQSWRSKPYSMSRSMSTEKHDIIKTQLMKLNHLDDAVYRPLLKHFDKLLNKFRNGADKKIHLVETRYGEIVDALDKRKGEIIKTLKQSTKANVAIIENKKKAMEKERAQLKECKRRHQNKLRDRPKSSDITINSFLAEVDDIQRKARKVSTDNSITEFDDLEIITDPEAESSIKDDLNKLVTLQQTAQLLKSRVGTPTSSLSSEESSQSSSTFSGDQSSRQTTRQSETIRPMSLRVPAQTRRTLTPNPPSFSGLPVTPRNVRSAADGSDIQDGNQGTQFLPDIMGSASPNGPAARQPPGSTQRRRTVPSDGRKDVRDNFLDDPSGGCLRSASDKNLPKRRDPSNRRSLPNRPSTHQVKLRPHVKYQTLMLDDAKLERPCGICCLGNDKKGVVAVADCGQGRIVNVDEDGKVIGAVDVWEDDGESVKGHGVFDVARMEGASIIVSDSHIKEVILFDRGRRLHSLNLPAQTDPRGVTSHAHHIFICDQGNRCVQMLDINDVTNGMQPKATPITLGQANEQVCPYFASVDRTGDRILVTDYGNGALILARTDNAQPPIRVKLRGSSVSSQYGRPGTSIDIRPTGVAWLPDGRGAVVADQIGHRLVVVDEEMKVIGRQGNGDGEFLFPHGVTFVSDTTLSVCDMNNARIQFVQLEALLANINY